jgi:hypothetical protein
MKEQAKLWGQYRMWVEEQNEASNVSWRERFDEYLINKKNEHKKYLNELKNFYRKQKELVRINKKYEKLSWFKKMFTEEPPSIYSIEYLRPRDYSIYLWPPFHYSPYKVSQEGFMNWLTDVKFFPIKEVKKMIQKDTVDMA